jgi:membrane-bound serine protease (ClpP class)
MILKILLFILIAYLLFEFIEHIVIPLLWIILKKKKRPLTGPSGLIGEVGEVKEWSNTEGRIFVHGELWGATSEEPLSPGDKAVIQDVQGLILTVKPHQKKNL